MKLRIARSATADPDEIPIYAARSSSIEAAEHLANLLMSWFETIVTHPCLGRVRGIYYRQERKLIVRVLHIKQASPHEAQFFEQK